MTEAAYLLEPSPFRLPASEQDEAQALLRDELVRVVIGDVLVVADAPDDAWVRARATQLLLPERARERWAVGFRTAVWVHTGQPSTVPPVAEVIVLPGQQRPASTFLRGRQVALAEGEVTQLHGLRVTTPLRTAADIARDLPAEEAVPLLGALAETCGVRPPQVLRQLSRMRYARGSAIARPVVRAWAEA